MDLSVTTSGIDQPRRRVAWLCVVPLALAGMLTLHVLADDAVQESPPADTDGEASAASETASSDAPPAEGDAPAEGEVPAEPAPAPEVPLPLALRPYRVLVSVCIPPEAEFNARCRDFILLRLREQIAGQLGSMWNAEVEFSPHVARGGADVLRKKADLLTGLYTESEYDKVFWLTVSGVGSRYDVAAIEWDGTFREPGAVFTRSTLDFRRIDEMLFEVMYDAFRPVAFVTEFEPREMWLTARAGELMPPTTSRAQFQPGDYLSMSLRALDRKYAVKEIRPIPWTYLRIESVDRARMGVTEISAFRSAVPEPQRRVEVAGLMLKIAHEETILSIASRGTPPEPLIASPVDVMDRYPTDEDPVDDRIRLISDRQGTVAVPAFPDSPLRYLIIHSGDQVLARVPIIPGVEQEMHLDVPDDAPRLNVEGELSILQGELIDTVARNAVLMARAEKAAEEGNRDEVTAIIAQLNEVDSLQTILNRIENYERAGVANARARNDRTQEARINNMCNNVADLARRHLDPDKRTQFDTRINDLLSAPRAPEATPTQPGT